MHMRQWDFRFLVIFVAAAATQAWAQQGGPAGSAAQSAASMPDFSGVWTHPYWPGFDPPLSGPGPVVNRSRLPNGVGNSDQLVGDYTNPILKREAAEVVKKHSEISLANVTYPTPANQCWPQPVPYILWTIGIQMLQQQDKITILYSNPDHESREVRMNQPHPARVTPSWYGDSVGHYEGDTLVIETVGIKADRPFAMVDMYGTPFTEALHVVERYRLLDYEATIESEQRGQRNLRRLQGSDPGFTRNPNYTGKGLQLQFTVEDPGVFTMPWSAGITYRRPLGDWPEMVCAETTHGHFSGEHHAVPTAS